MSWRPGGSGLPFQDEGILSTWNDGTYAELDGTSQASPHVAGVAALLVSKGVKGQAAVQRILDTATDAGPAGPDTEYGAGIVNAAARSPAFPARRRARPAPPAAQQRRAGVVPPPLRIRTVLRRGLRVRCLAAGSGRCRVAAKRGRGKVLSGSKRVRAGRSAVVTTRASRRGRRLLRRALRRRNRVRLVVRVNLPGASVRRKITLLP